MTLCEALKTGLPFRRKGWTDWANPKVQVHSVLRDDAIAEDWEVKSEPREFYIAISFSESRGLLGVSYNGSFPTIGLGRSYEVVRVREVLS